MKILLTIFTTFTFLFAHAQNFGNLPKIPKEQLLNDLELLHQGLDKFHSGVYWYTSKDSVDLAFKNVKNQIIKDLNVLEFHKLIAPLVALTREDHTDITLPKDLKEKLKTEATYLPLVLVFLGKELYCYKNASDYQNTPLEGKRIESINGETPVAIVEKIGNLFASDGYIKPVKFRDLGGFNFSRHYFYYYGKIDLFEIKFEEIEETVVLESARIGDINANLKRNYVQGVPIEKKDPLEFKLLNDSTAYLGVHTFGNDDIKEESKEKNFKSFLENSFQSINENNIKTLVIDVSQNAGGSEGNEGLLYSYLGNNYQKYKKVRVKTPKAILNNGVDKPIKLKAFGFFERIFANKKQKDGSLERKEGVGLGLMAYKKEPEYKFSGKTYVIIGPKTYSGGSEFSNMVYTNDIATFVGQETGGGYLGNTSGYSGDLILPNSKIEIDIPALQFIMNVKPKLPFGSGVIPDYEVIPTFEEYINRENAPLKYILEILEKH
ncbi:MAG: S41 family peptidase [Crocinitomicaceae bacterium]|nr:S41 family peptidase [Crocinitomicaceae bacterium]